MTYDEWKSRDPNDYWDAGPAEDGCTCLRLGAGGRLLTDEWCAIHGREPDAEYERMRDDG